MTQFKKRGGLFLLLDAPSSEIANITVLDQPTVDNEGFSRGRSVAAAVGCWLLALQRHFYGTSTALQWKFNGTSMELQWNFNNGNSVGSNILVSSDWKSKLNIEIDWMFTKSAPRLNQSFLKHPKHFFGELFKQVWNLATVLSKRHTHQKTVHLASEPFFFYRFSFFQYFALALNNHLTPKKKAQYGNKFSFKLFNCSCLKYSENYFS